MYRAFLLESLEGLLFFCILPGSEVHEIEPDPGVLADYERLYHIIVYMLYYVFIMWWYTIWCYAILYYILYCTVPYCTVLYCTVLYCTVLYCTIIQYILRHFILSCYVTANKIALYSINSSICSGNRGQGTKNTAIRAAKGLGHGLARQVRNRIRASIQKLPAFVPLIFYMYYDLLWYK